LDVAGKSVHTIAAAGTNIMMDLNGGFMVFLFRFCDSTEKRPGTVLEA